MAAAFGAGTLAALAPADAGWAAALQAQGNLLAAAGVGGMGVATVLIHIYVKPLKQFLQALLAVGVAGGTYLAVAHPGLPLPAYVAASPSAVWLVGPAFASLTGICFKEGLCYGKQESAALTLLIPTLLLGHLSGLLPEAGERGLAAVIAGLLALFAARKYSQAIKDDIGGEQQGGFGGMEDWVKSPLTSVQSLASASQHGQAQAPICMTLPLPAFFSPDADKSVFEFYALDEVEQQRRVEQLQRQQAQAFGDDE